MVSRLLYSFLIPMRHSFLALFGLGRCELDAVNQSLRLCRDGLLGDDLLRQLLPQQLGALLRSRLRTRELLLDGEEVVRDLAGVGAFLLRLLELGHGLLLFVVA